MQEGTLAISTWPMAAGMGFGGFKDKAVREFSFNQTSVVYPRFGSGQFPSAVHALD
jgi:hypothetical protein